MQAQLWSLSGLSCELDIDRRSLERKIKDLKPDETEVKGNKTYNKYFMSRVVEHLMGGQGLDYTAERARLAKEQADKTEMENSVRRGELMETAEIVKVVGDHIHAAKTKLLAMPAQLSSYLAHKEANDVQSQLSDAIYDCLTELAEGTRDLMDPAEKADS